MLRHLAKGIRSASTYTPQAFRFTSPHPTHITPENTELFVKRVIKCVRERLLTYDPERWTGVEISYNTHWLRPNGKLDIATCIQVHEALEREFKVEILDQRFLVVDVESACALVSGLEDIY
jgi:hypothetical protein